MSCIVLIQLIDDVHVIYFIGPFSSNYCCFCCFCCCFDDNDHDDGGGAGGGDGDGEQY